MKLWEKGYDVLGEIHRFTAGRDRVLDEKLIPFDCRASIAHANMLHKIELLTGDERDTLVSGLEKIIDLHSKGEFVITPEEEDGHTAIERWLTDQYGDVGKKIHTARSRNDQVLVAMRLYEKEQLAQIRAGILDYRAALGALIETSGEIPMPGYTHMRKAMPSSIAMWLGSFAEAADDNIAGIESTLKLVDQSPLGTAAGFGVPVFDIDRDMTARELGFKRVTKNPMYAQLSRGKFEAAILHACSQVLFDLNRLASDLLLFTMDEFRFLMIDQTLCTGSSIMPQKKNADVLELIRASYHMVVGEELQAKSVMANLMSGYHRDGQFTKEPVMNGLERTRACLSVMAAVLDGLTVNEEACRAAVTEEVLATAEAYQLVKEGMPFRDAYRRIAARFSD